MSREIARLALLSLAAFVYVTSELLPVGAMDSIAEDLGTSRYRVGLLLTAYAGFVALTAIPMTRLTSGVDRRRVIVVTVIVLGLGNLVASCATSYEILVAGRLLTATGHGVFWSSIGPATARLAAPGRAGAATSAVFAGNALALVLGSPLTNALAQQIGWRGASAMLGGAALLLAGVLARCLPAIPVRRRPAASGRSTGTPPGVLGVCASTLLIVTAYFAAYTYIIPVLAGAGLTPGQQPIALLAFGLTALLGIYLTGRSLDAHPRSTIRAQALITMGALGGLALVPNTAAFVLGVLLLLALGYAGMAVSWQTSIIRLAPESPDVASAFYVVCFQLGICAGPVIGGIALDRGGLTGAASVACACAALGALTTILSRRPR